MNRVGLDPELCRSFARDRQGSTQSLVSLAADLRVVDFQALLTMSPGPCSLLLEATNELAIVAQILNVKAAEMEQADRGAPTVLQSVEPLQAKLERALTNDSFTDASEMSAEEAVEILRQNFDTLDGIDKRNGKFSFADAESVFAVTRNDQLAQAILRIANDPIAFQVLDTGGDSSNSGDGIISRKDMDLIADFDPGLSSMLRNADLLMKNMNVVDTAARRNRVDGRFSVNDLKAVASWPDLDPELRDAAKFFLDNRELLPYLTAFKERKPFLLVRTARGLESLGGSLLTLTNPTWYAIQFIRKPLDTLKLPFRFGLSFGRGVAEGVIGGVVGTAQTVWELAKLSPMAFSFDPYGTLQRYDALGASLLYMVQNPGETLEVVIDLETLENDPARWLGKLAPTIVLAVASGGAVTAAEKGAVVTNALNKASKVRGLKRVAAAAQLARTATAPLRSDADLVGLQKAFDGAGLVIGTVDDLDTTENGTVPNPSLVLASRWQSRPSQFAGGFDLSRTEPK